MRELAERSRDRSGPDEIENAQCQIDQFRIGALPKEVREQALAKIVPAQLGLPCKLLVSETSEPVRNRIHGKRNCTAVHGVAVESGLEGHDVTGEAVLVNAPGALTDLAKRKTVVLIPVHGVRR